MIRRRPTASGKPFKAKLTQVGDEAKPDELRLVCSYVYYIEDLFERFGDSEGLALLQRLEEQCC
ncbi:MAG: N(2)-fixation sustaining protein CowN [Rhodospirillales bacterium]